MSGNRPFWPVFELDYGEGTTVFIVPLCSTCTSPKSLATVLANNGGNSLGKAYAAEWVRQGLGVAVGINVGSSLTWQPKLEIVIEVRRTFGPQLDD